MAIIKTARLSGKALDWAVAKCNGWERVNGVWRDPQSYYFDGDGEKVFHPKPYGGGTFYSPSTDWSQGGPIIDREKISIYYMDWLNTPQKWMAGTSYAAHPLIAAMHCYVTSKFGDEIEVPDDVLF